MWRFRAASVKLATCLSAAALLAILGPGQAQAAGAARYPYVLVDLGTLGGPQSGVANDAPIPFSTRQGAFVETADTPLTDPSAPNDNPFFSGDTAVQHAFVWHNGAITDLGALGSQPDNNSSMSTSVN